jgi:hypothetical protein
VNNPERDNAADRAARSDPPCTCPAQARELFDRLEAKVGTLPHTDGSLHGDYVTEVPGSSEPPD